MSLTNAILERVLRVLVAIRYINEDGVKLYSANNMTRHMTHPHNEARIKFMLVSFSDFLELIC